VKAKPANWSSARRLLKRLRDVMAEKGSAQERLDKIVCTIATEMVSEVCSIYVMRPGAILELFATEGLNPDAVHNTHLRVGEGLIGEIAQRRRPLSQSDAKAHPNFAYRPETGEDSYSSLLGVPLLRSDRVWGVLAIQNRTRRHYNREEQETLETIAMVVAELVAGGELLKPKDLRQIAGETTLPLRIEGVRFNHGLAMGQAVIHKPEVVVHRIIAEDPQHEGDRLIAAVDGMQSDLDAMLNAVDEGSAAEHRDILEAYRMFAADRGWLRKIDEAIKTGLTAEAAVERVRRDTRARMRQVHDPYIRERLQDLEDLANRLLRYLILEEPVQPEDLPDDAVVIARNMGPAELLDYDRNKLRALVLEEGSATAHVAIIARALDVPVVGRCPDILYQTEPGDLVIVDADHAQVFVRPTEFTHQSMTETIKLRDTARSSLANFTNLPPITKDGEKISILLNIGLLVDMDMLGRTCAEGVGLYRTEIPFMVRSAYPDVETQTELYRRIYEKADGRPVVFRLLDAGGDKRLPYWHDLHEENPAMGWRAVRISLDRPALLRQQIRALIRASEGRPLSILYPMIAEVAEFRAGRDLVDMEIERARAKGWPIPDPLSVGAMLEVPALVFQLPALLRHADFLAIGSNDLCQFLLASDRGNPRIASRYDPLSPSVLSVFHQVAQQCNAAHKPLSLCGEMAGQTLEAMALLGVGIKRLSMVPSAAGPVRAMVRSVNLSELTPYVEQLLSAENHSLRGKLRDYAMDHNIVL